METLETDKAPRELEEWEQHYYDHKDMTLDEKRQLQFSDLVNTLKNLSDHFESVFLIALKNTEGEKLIDSEIEQLRQQVDAKILVKRIQGLKKVFGPVFYTALEKVVGNDVIKIKENVEEEEKPAEDETEEKETAASTQTHRVPKGFSRWDLKQIKLHESQPEKNKRTWVEYWTLRGDSGVGEVLYQDGRDLYYFRPFDTANMSTFPLTESRARKASREGRNYYFKKTVAPAGAN